MSNKKKNNTKIHASPISSVGFISLGCAKNLVDSQVMADTILANGLTMAPSPETADMILVNTCSFIGDAREESEEAIRSACDFKKNGNCQAVLVTGCMPQRYKTEMPAKFPEVDAFLGVDELDKVGEIIKRLNNGESGIIQISHLSTRIFESSKPGVVFSRGCYAYLKIAEGCNHHCTFCAIPGIRGAYRSKTPSMIVKEAANLITRGFRELDLISQDTMSYGSDLNNPSTLAELITLLSDIQGDFWIRILYGYPTAVTDDLLKTIAASPKICRYFDIPVQHSDPSILQGMGRTGTIDSVTRMTERIRNIMPDVTLRTTCLVGFPGEQEKHFRNLCDFIEQNKFDHVGVFTFSPEEGTPARKMTNRPSQKITRERTEILLNIQQQIIKNKTAGMIGTTAEILLEKPEQGSKNVWYGRSRRLAPEVDGTIFVENVPAGMSAGTFVKAKYIAAADYDMKAVILGE